MTSTVAILFPFSFPFSFLLEFFFFNTCDVLGILRTIRLGAVCVLTAYIADLTLN